MSKLIYTAIVFFPAIHKKRPRKYKNVSTPAGLTLNMRRQGADYINFYNQKTNNYEFRLYCNSQVTDTRQIYNNEISWSRIREIEKQIKARHEK